MSSTISSELLYFALDLHPQREVNVWLLAYLEIIREFLS